jgi:hypothetical protein
MDCLRFVEENAEDLERYFEITGTDSDDAGLDFAFRRFSGRNGFQDNGVGPVFKRLDDATDAMGRVEPVYGKDDLICFAYPPEIT